MVSYINKEGGIMLGPLCALLWKILTWCSMKQVTLIFRHIPGHLNVIADKLSRLSQIIQMKWSLLLEVFQSISRKKVTKKLPLYVSLIPDPLASAVDVLSLPCEDLDAYAFPPVSILGKVMAKLQDYLCKRIILITPRWPNMPWFWELMAMSSQIPLCLSNLPILLTQPFNPTPHRNRPNLSHTWLLETQLSKNKAL